VCNKSINYYFNLRNILDNAIAEKIRASFSISIRRPGTKLVNTTKTYSFPSSNF